MLLSDLYAFADNQGVEPCAAAYIKGFSDCFGGSVHLDLEGFQDEYDRGWRAAFDLMPRRMKLDVLRRS